ncbi:MAG: peptide deformylase [Deltaproteobacteria bacterium]|nr:peptide deformylase [Deltaproteobacteria bacterium]
MAVRDILIWPDPELLKVSAPITAIDDGVRALIKDLFDTMYDADGVGLAAPQIGVHRRVVVVDIRTYEREQDGEKVDIPKGEGPLVLINPTFVKLAGELEWEEGCLSVPGETGLVTRAALCTVKFLDQDGKERLLEAEGLKAVALQHECDHLDGKLFVDYLSRLKRNVIRKKMLKLLEEREQGDGAEA